MKVQLDMFVCPVRLNQGQLHNNKLGIGRNMSNVKLPIIKLAAKELPTSSSNKWDLDNAQINSSCVLSYLGIRGVGLNMTSEVGLTRDFNDIPYLSYVDIYKNYYANKQEEIGYVIHRATETIIETIDSIVVDAGSVPEAPGIGTASASEGSLIPVNFTGAEPKASHLS